MLILLDSVLRAASGGSDSRGVLGIMWSCASALVVSAWLASRPNANPQSQARKERVRLAINMIVGPEIVLVWALKHMYSAYRIKSMFKGWTLTHAHFLIMGGFSVLGQDDKPHSLTFEDFDRGFSVQPDQQNDYVLTFDFHQGSCTKGPAVTSTIPTFTFNRGFSVLASEDFLRSFKFAQQTMHRNIILGKINDGARNDWAVELVATLYVLWFVVRCGARVRYGLVITELEFTTLILMLLHAIVYMVWWHRPIAVDEIGSQKTGIGLISVAAPMLFLVPNAISILDLHLGRIFEVYGPAHRAILSASYFHLVPILKFFHSVVRVLFIPCSIIFQLPYIHIRGLLSRITLGITPILVTCGAIAPFKRYLDCCLHRTSYLHFVLDAIMVLIAIFFSLVITNFVDGGSEEVTPAETSGYLLKTSRRIILAILHFSEKGFLGLVNVPMLCIGFVLFLSLSPFALAIAIVLHIINKNTLVSREHERVDFTRKSFKFVLKAPDRTRFGVTYYILFIPLILRVAFLFLFIVFLNLLLLVGMPFKDLIQFLFDPYSYRIGEVLLIPYAPFPKGTRYPCLAAASVTSLAFFVLQIGWNFQFPHHCNLLQMSWLASCLAIFLIPVITIPLILTLKGNDSTPVEFSTIRAYVTLLPDLVLVFLSLVYSSARIFLIPQAIVLLILGTQASSVVGRSIML